MKTETYRGVRLKVTRGREHGWLAHFVNGVPWGEWPGTDEAKALAGMHGYVDGAIERPEAYAGYWQPKTVALTPVKVTARHPNARTGRLEAWAAESVERDDQDRPVWTYTRTEDSATTWEARHVSHDQFHLAGSLKDARAATASGRALAVIVEQERDLAAILAAVKEVA